MRTCIYVIAALTWIGPWAAHGASNVRTLSAGPINSLAVAEDGTVWTWGAQNRVAVRINGLTGVVAVAAGVSDNFALKGDGTVWVWPAGASTPHQVTALNGSVAIAAGATGLALKSDGTVWEFGSHSAPSQVLDGVMALSAAPEHNLALASDGTVWAWGHNACGQLGDGPTADNSGAPVRVKGLSDVVAVSAGGVRFRTLLVSLSVGSGATVSR